MMSLRTILGGLLVLSMWGATCVDGTPSNKPIRPLEENPARIEGSVQDSSERVKLIVELSDGSTAIGTPHTADIDVVTPFGAIEVPFDGLREIVFLVHPDSVLLSFPNGDMIHGKVTVSVFELETILGNLEIPLSTVVSIRTNEITSVLPEKLVAYYSFDGNANDQSGQGNHGVVHGATLTADRHGTARRAYFFDGVDDYIEVSHRPVLNPVNALTIALWVRVDGITNTWSPLFHKGGSSSPGYANREYALWLKGNPFFHFTSAGDGQGEHQIGSEQIPTDVWIFVAIVANRSAHVLQLYIDGSLVSERTDSYSSFNANEHRLLIGWSDERQSDYSPFKGVLDDIRIYSTALTPAQIQKLYGSETGAK